MPKITKVIKKTGKPEKYFETVGRRKSANARVRLFADGPASPQGGEKLFLINEKPLSDYFPTFELQQIVQSPLVLMDCLNNFGVRILVTGGGIHSQSEAARHGISRGLVLFNPEFRKRLKKAGFLKRDPRVKERKKPGLKRARKASQWAKR